MAANLACGQMRQRGGLLLPRPRQRAEEARAIACGADEMAERLLPHASRLPPPTLPTKERSLESVWSSMGLVGKDDASKGGSSDLL